MPHNYRLAICLASLFLAAASNPTTLVGEDAPVRSTSASEALKAVPTHLPADPPWVGETLTVRLEKDSTPPNLTWRVTRDGVPIFSADGKPFTERTVTIEKVSGKEYSFQAVSGTMRGDVLKVSIVHPSTSAGVTASATQPPATPSVSEAASGVGGSSNRAVAGAGIGAIESTEFNTLTTAVSTAIVSQILIDFDHRYPAHAKGLIGRLAPDGPLAKKEKFAEALDAELNAFLSERIRSADTSGMALVAWDAVFNVIRAEVRKLAPAGESERVGVLRAIQAAFLVNPTANTGRSSGGVGQKVTLESLDKRIAAIEQRLAGMSSYGTSSETRGYSPRRRHLFCWRRR